MSAADDLDRLLTRLWQDQVKHAQARQRDDDRDDEGDKPLQPTPSPGVGPERVAELQALPSLADHCARVLREEWQDAEARMRELERPYPHLAALKVHPQHHLTR